MLKPGLEHQSLPLRYSLSRFIIQMVTLVKAPHLKKKKKILQIQLFKASGRDVLFLVKATLIEIP